MAGDVGIVERVIGPLPEGAARPPILHEYGPRVRIAIATGVAAETPAAPTIERAGLSETEEAGLEAYELRRSEKYVAAKAARPRAGVNWDDAGVEPLHKEEGETGLVPPPPRPEGAPAEAPAAPTSDRLAGRVAVGVFMVSGQQQRLRLSSQEQVKIVAEVQNGLSWLGAQSPARDVTWVYETHAVTVDVPEVTFGTTYESFEAPWRDAAMQKLNLAPGRGGLKTYVHDLRTRLHADRAYCAFFTKYRLFHFAYADMGGPHLVMHFDNDGWGTDNIDRVFAHETGHIFGAPDEYSGARCGCGGSHGFFRKPNGNCESCAPQGGVDCIMRANTWAMCSFTPLHLGFNGVGA
jgi:hypothetical protein